MGVLVLTKEDIKAYIVTYYKNHHEKALPVDVSVEKFKEIFATFENDPDKDKILARIEYLFTSHTLATIEAYIEEYESNLDFKKKYINFLVVLLQKRIDDIKHVSDKDFFGLYEATRNLNKYDYPHDVWKNYFNKLEEVLKADLKISNLEKIVEAYQAGFKGSKLKEDYEDYEDYTNQFNVDDQVEGINVIKTYDDPKFFDPAAVKNASEEIWDTYWKNLEGVLMDDAASKKK